MRDVASIGVGRLIIGKDVTTESRRISRWICGMANGTLVVLIYPNSRALLRVSVDFGHSEDGKAALQRVRWW